VPRLPYGVKVEVRPVAEVCPLVEELAQQQADISPQPWRCRKPLRPGAHDMLIKILIVLAVAFIGLLVFRSDAAL
jgi:hypothetical protein